MIRSMTAFASGESDTALGHITCEIRSVNHRYLEISTRLPEVLRNAEPALREIIGTHLRRGKVDVNVKLRTGGDSAPTELVVNHELAQRLAEIQEELQGLFPESATSSVADVMRWPGLITEAEPDQAPLRQSLIALVSATTADLVKAREREGESLSRAIEERLDKSRQQTAAVQGALPDIRKAQRQRLSERVAEFADQLDAQRLEQEVALLLQKTDVDEELDRLLAHLDEAQRVLTLDEPVGRRLDFVMQELNREANTLGSKSVDQRMTQASVELKVLIEQMREQVQNIE